MAGLEAKIALPAIAVSLALRDIYEGVELMPRPRLVQGEPEERTDAAHERLER